MPFLPQDSSSVIQFMARAKVKVDPALRVVEIANGNAEETLVSSLPWDSSPQRIGVLELGPEEKEILSAKMKGLW